MDNEYSLAPVIDNLTADFSDHSPKVVSANVHATHAGPSHAWCCRQDGRSAGQPGFGS